MKNFLAILIVAGISNCTNQGKLIHSKQPGGYITSSTGLQYKILTKGSGSKAKEGQEVLLRETTSYMDGTVLYSNETSKSPVKVLIGGNQATNAVDEGLRGMQVGEVRELIAKPELVRRKSYPANVSPDSTLKIKLILVSIIKPGE
jgi:FKBP-type peptidyl-prolyl cis-trans isomerase